MLLRLNSVLFLSRLNIGSSRSTCNRVPIWYLWQRLLPQEMKMQSHARFTHVTKCERWSLQDRLVLLGEVTPRFITWPRTSTLSLKNPCILCVVSILASPCNIRMIPNIISSWSKPLATRRSLDWVLTLTHAIASNTHVHVLSLPRIHLMILDKYNFAHRECNTRCEIARDGGDRCYNWISDRHIACGIAGSPSHTCIGTSVCVRLFVIARMPNVWGDT